MPDKRLCRLFAGLAAVLLLTIATAPLTAFGDGLPPPAAGSADISPAPPAPTSGEASGETSDVTSTETSIASSTPDPGSETSASESSSAAPPASPSSESTAPSESSASSESAVAPADSSSSAASIPDSNLPAGSSDLPIGSSNLPLGTSDLPMLMALRPDTTCYIGATVSFAQTTINPANGDPIVTLKLERLSNNKKETEQVWFITRRFSGGTQAMEFSFEGLPMGNYRLTQVPLLRYKQLDYRRGGHFWEADDVTCSLFSDCSFNGVIAEYTLRTPHANGQAFIRNAQKTPDFCTDTDLAVNRIMLPHSSGGGCDDDDSE